MGKIVVSENVTLDGVIQDPTGDEGFSFGGWFTEISDKDREAFTTLLYEEALAAEAVLLGGRSYRWFTPRWQPRPGEWADRLRILPKYVVSTTLDDLQWSNSTVLTGDAVTEVAKLKQSLNGDIVVYASAQLVHTLMEHDLVDELRLLVYPFVLGGGVRVFGETSHRKRLRLVDHRTIGDGLVLMTYECVREV